MDDFIQLSAACGKFTVKKTTGTLVEGWNADSLEDIKSILIKEEWIAEEGNDWSDLLDDLARQHKTGDYEAWPRKQIREMQKEITESKLPKPGKRFEDDSVVITSGVSQYGAPLAFAVRHGYVFCYLVGQYDVNEKRMRYARHSSTFETALEEYQQRLLTEEEETGA